MKKKKKNAASEARVIMLSGGSSIEFISDGMVDGFVGMDSGGFYIEADDGFAEEEEG